MPEVPGVMKFHERCGQEHRLNTPCPIKWEPQSPDWADGGRRVQLLLKNGRTLDGILDCHDVFFDGEDECPVWMLLADDGVYHSFWDHEEFRYLTERASWLR